MSDNEKAPNVLHTTSEMTREERAQRVEEFRKTAQTKTLEKVDE